MGSLLNEDEDLGTLLSEDEDLRTLVISFTFLFLLKIFF
jgi:hypothetical protein